MELQKEGIAAGKQGTPSAPKPIFTLATSLISVLYSSISFHRIVNDGVKCSFETEGCQTSAFIRRIQAICLMSLHFAIHKIEMMTALSLSCCDSTV
jgi:hypothetical protein